VQRPVEHWAYLRRSLRNCPQKLRELAYTSICRSVLEYASLIWDPYLQCDIDSLECIQHKAARFTTRDFRQRSSVTAMMRDLQWEHLAERRTKARVRHDFTTRGNANLEMKHIPWQLSNRNQICMAPYSKIVPRVILMYLILNDKVAIPISPSILQRGRRGRFIQPAHHYIHTYIHT